MNKIQEIDEQTVDLGAVMAGYGKAKTRKAQWEKLWKEAYDYALPQRNCFDDSTIGAAKVDKLYDGTALDAVEQLAASMLGNLTPPWTQWFGFKPGPDLSPAQAEQLAPVLEKAAQIIQSHFDRSNFLVEMHQCYLDLVVGGTAALAFEENEPGAFSAFKFSAIPLGQMALAEGNDGYLRQAYRTLPLTLSQMKERYPLSEIPAKTIREGEKDPQRQFEVLEAIIPDQLGAYAYQALLVEGRENNPAILHYARLDENPVIAFRWMKSPGEIYGRSPVMKALPDIKTANKVVELILKNASIAVTGIWQADDDGVLNPANIELKPGAIIPKAVGSQGLRPLDMPGSFDVSQIVLDDLRTRIRHALLTDKLGPVVGAKMTATEVLERSAEMALLLGATYGRLQSELLTPLIKRAYRILRRRGEVPDVALDGRYVVLDYRAPLARAQGQRNVQNTLSWISSVLAMGAEASTAINLPEAARFLGDAMGVPSDLIRKETM